MNNSDLYRTNKLRELFIRKIALEWNAKWSDKHGPNPEFTSLKSQNAFLNDLINDIEKSLKNKIGLDETSKILIGKDNLRRIFNQQQPSLWKEKTRNTLAYYLDYKGWQEFVLSDIDAKLKLTPSKTLKKNKMDTVFSILFILITFFSLGTIFTKLYINHFIAIDFDKKTSTFTFPATVNLIGNIPFAKLFKFQIQIDNELFQYAEHPTLINVTESKISKKLNFFSPGIKKISISNNATIIKRIPCIINTGSTWYASVCTKNYDFPLAFEGDIQKVWYGAYNVMSNSERNYLSTPMQWTEYLINIKNKFPNGELAIPDHLLNKDLGKNTIVNFTKCEKFSISLDSTQILFRAKKTLHSSDDCLSFECDLTDEKFQKIQLFSSNNCNVDNNLNISSDVGLNKEFYKIKLNRPNFNRIFEDEEWHYVNISILHKKVKILIDNKLLFNEIVENNFQNLCEISIVFAGNGIIDDFVLRNSQSKKVVFHDTFSK